MTYRNIKFGKLMHTPRMHPILIGCGADGATDDGRYVHPLNSLNQNNSHGAKIGARIRWYRRT
jgi:hypothetical protein